MALTFKERFKHNLFIWFFGLTKVRLILFCRPKIVDINDDEVILCIPLNRQTRNHVNSMYIGAMTVGADLVTGITAMLNIRESKRNIVLMQSFLSGQKEIPILFVIIKKKLSRQCKK